MIEYSLEDFNIDVEILVDIIIETGKSYAGIYGIPQGGVPLAIALSQKLNTPLVAFNELVDFKAENLDILIVDDLIDSGQTMKNFAGYDVAVLGVKPHTAFSTEVLFFIARDFPADWIHFWWEPPVKIDGESIVTRFLEYIGEDPTRPGLVETPDRIVRMWGELYRGYDEKNMPKLTVVPNGEDGVFYDELLRDSGYFFSQCEHHGVPFFGQYYFGYIPSKKILGASKIGRLVDHYSARLQIAERLVNQVINKIEEEVEPLGSILVMNARHLCKEMRGLKKWNSPYEAIATRGIFRKNENGCKAEFMARLPKL